MSTTASRHSSESAFFQLLLTVHCLHCDLHHLAAQNLPRSRPIVFAVRYACCTHSWPLLYFYVDDGQCILSITASPKAHSSNLRTQHVVTSRHAFQFKSSMQWRGGTVWTFLIFFSCNVSHDRVLSCLQVWVSKGFFVGVTTPGVKSCISDTTDLTRRWRSDIRPMCSAHSSMAQSTAPKLNSI